MSRRRHPLKRWADNNSEIVTNVLIGAVAVGGAVGLYLVFLH